MKRFISLLIIIPIVMFSSVTTIASEIPEDTTIKEEYIEYIEDICDKYGMCPELIEAIIESESGGNPDRRSSCDARGLMQIIPRYHQDDMYELGITDLFDPYQNIELGVYIISNLAAEYDDLYAVLMAYNEGEFSGAVERAEEGKWSEYSKKIVNRTQELERLHGK